MSHQTIRGSAWWLKNPAVTLGGNTLMCDPTWKFGGCTSCLPVGKVWFEVDCCAEVVEGTDCLPSSQVHQSQVVGYQPLKRAQVKSSLEASYSCYVFLQHRQTCNRAWYTAKLVGACNQERPAFTCSGQRAFFTVSSQLSGPVQYEVDM